MAILANRRVMEFMTVIGLSGLIAGAGAAMVLVVFAVAIGIFAVITLFQALILWAAWNWTAPHLDVIPVAYQHIDFLVMWGIVATLRIVGRVVFDTTKKESK